MDAFDPKRVERRGDPAGLVLRGDRALGTPVRALTAVQEVGAEDA